MMLPAGVPGRQRTLVSGPDGNDRGRRPAVPGHLAPGAGGPSWPSTGGNGEPPCSARVRAGAVLVVTAGPAAVAAGDRAHGENAWRWSAQGLPGWQIGG